MMSEHEEGLRSAAAAGVLVATGGFLAIVVWLHFVRSDLDPVARGVSRYAAGPYGLAITLAFGSLSLAVVTAAALLKSATSRRGLVVAAVGLLLVVAFPLRSASPTHGEYFLHQFGGAVFFVAATIGVFGIAGKLRTVPAPAWLQRTARVSSAAAGAGLIVFFTSVAARHSLLGPWLGLFQRICFAAICTALLTLALGLIRESPTDSGPLASKRRPRPRGAA